MKLFLGIILGLFLGVTVGVCMGVFYFNKKFACVLYEESKMTQKYRGYFNALVQWIGIKQSNVCLDKYFVKKGYKTIAIYGMGDVGNLLYKELKNTQIIVKYAIDRLPESTYSDLNVFGKDDDLTEVDVIVVTVNFDFEEISNELKRKINCPIISVDEVVFGV